MFRSPVMRMWLCLAVAVSLAGAGVATADDSQSARSAYEEGARHFDLEEWGPALDAFKRAYLRLPSPDFLFNIAQCHRKLGHNQEALDFYKKYVGFKPDSKDRPDVERIIAQLEQVIADDKKAKEAPPPVLVAPTPAPPPVAVVAPIVEAPPPPPPPEPVYKKWWLWTAVGVVVVGIGVGLGVGLSGGSTPTVQTTLGTVKPF